MAKRRFIVHGKVQGVSLRWQVKEYCQAKGLAGYVKNLPDNTVAIGIRGTADELDSFLAWLQSSPGSSQVEDITESEETDSLAFEDFRILY